MSASHTTHTYNIHREPLHILKSLIMAHGDLPCAGPDKAGLNQNHQGAHPGELRKGHLRIFHSHGQTTSPLIPTKGIEMIRQSLTLTSTLAVRIEGGGGFVFLLHPPSLIRTNIHPAVPTQTCDSVRVPIVPCSQLL